MGKPLHHEWSGRLHPRQSLLHWPLILVVVGLMTFGSVMVYSATSLYLGAVVESVMHKQLMAIAMGALMATMCYHTKMAFFRKFSPLIFMIAVLLLMLVLVPGIGVKVKGAVRWIGVGAFRFQVSEFVKLAVVLFGAWYVVTNRHYMHSVSRGLFALIVITLICAVFLMLQPDLGATVVIALIVLGIFFLAGLNLKFFVLMLALLGSGIGLMIFYTPWRLARFLAFLDPWDPETMANKGWQLSQSLIAFGRGHFSGVGLGFSIEKIRYLPEAHTDFILAIVAEEAGFFGIVFLLFLYYWLVRYSMEIGRVAIRLEHLYSGLVAQGIAVWFAAQVVINGLVVMGWMPTKGLTLPFVSYGSSATIVSLIAIGILLRIHRENQKHH